MSLGKQESWKQMQIFKPKKSRSHEQNDTKKRKLMLIKQLITENKGINNTRRHYL